MVFISTNMTPSIVAPPMQMKFLFALIATLRTKTMRKREIAALKRRAALSVLAYMLNKALTTKLYKPSITALCATLCLALINKL